MITVTQKTTFFCCSGSGLYTTVELIGTLQTSVQRQGLTIMNTTENSLYIQKC